MSDATLASLLPVAVIAPIGGAILAPLAARVHRRAPLCDLAASRSPPRSRCCS